METVILQHLDLSDGSFGLKGVSPSYLNCIPLSKYRHYCGINRIRVKLESPVKSTVSIKYLFQEKAPLIEKHLIDNTCDIIIDQGDVIVITSSESNSIKGIVEATVDSIRHISLEHVVCTYHREKAVHDKIKLFSEAHLDCYHMTIIDNGSTLNIENNSMLSIIKSPNLGGASGFTRGIVEGMKKRCTHILLNDDDAYIDPESVFRMIQFLSIISSKYYEYCISGIFLDIDHPNTIRETSGLFENGLITIFNEGKHVDSDDTILSISHPDPSNYAAWTCFCIPASIIAEKKLPLPVFVKFDDIEYGRRLGGKIITIPGISIWHQSFAGYPLSYSYYIMRNRLVVLSSSNELNPVSVNNSIDRILSEIAAYRYDCAKEMIKGVDDFLKGSDYVFGCCVKGMHKVIPIKVEDSAKLKPKLKDKKLIKEPSRKSRLFTMNGLFLLSLGDIELNRCETETKFFYRVGKVLYLFDDNKGILRKRSCFKAISLTIMTLLRKRKIMKKISDLNSDYMLSLDKYSSVEQWEELWNHQQ